MRVSEWVLTSFSKHGGFVLYLPPKDSCPRRNLSQKIWTYVSANTIFEQKRRKLDPAWHIRKIQVRTYMFQERWRSKQAAKVLKINLKPNFILALPCQKFYRFSSHISARNTILKRGCNSSAIHVLRHGLKLNNTFLLQASFFLLDSNYERNFLVNSSERMTYKNVLFLN